MKQFGRIVAIAGGVVLMAAVAVCGWLYLYTADLPSIAELCRYNPAAASEIQIRANSLTHVVPSDLLGNIS
jgi:membrane carboxypeptidase/penicillin-binding protein